jgi:hypothetical protein
MRRTVWLASMAGIAGIATIVGVWIAAGTAADPGKTDPPPVAAASRAAPQLPVTGCSLFSSGVGYFVRDGEVEGDARIDLTFPVTDINDLLKSMVLLDLGGGRIDAVSYDSHDPIDRTLKSFAIDLTRNPTFADVLNQARGEKVEVVQQQAANQPGTLTGTVVGVERQRQPAGKDTLIDVDVLNLWCAEGIRSVKLADVQRLRFLNPVMESEFRRALEVLALSHDTQKKAVSLSFAGQGKRPVRVGYVVENPIWKTSYRLTVDKNEKVYLQGWAVVENPTDEDWKDVRMSLISGRPISFQMDLYQPLYVPRPMVVPELFASLTPRTYEGAMDEDQITGNAQRNAIDKLKEVQKKENQQKAQRAQQLFAAGAISKEEADAINKQAGVQLNLTKGVESSAAALQLGDQFQYRIKHAVNLPRQKSALLPIVGSPVDAKKVSIFNEKTHAKFPLLGLKFKNTSGDYLMQGPITVFENDVYAGDSRILDLQPGEERLLSFAVDLGTEVEMKPKVDNGQVTKVKIYKGLVYTTTQAKESKLYKAKNRSPQDRVLVVEHPYRPEFRLVGDAKPVEKARDVYRFEVKLPAGKTGELEVAEERDVVQAVQLSNTDDETIRVILRKPVVSDKVKAALQKAMDLKSAHAKTQQDLAHAQQQHKDIVDDQTRLRANLKEMPRDAAAYKKYLDKFDKQEGEIEELQATVKKLQATEVAQRQEYDGYLAGLEVE